jgi:hypothetical protein
MIITCRSLESSILHRKLAIESFPSFLVERASADGISTPSEVINLVASMIESSGRCFDFVDRELHNIRKLLEAIKPWYRGLDEERELESLEGRLKPLRDKAKSFLLLLREGRIRGLEYLSFDEVLYVTREAIVTVESVEKLWRRVERVAQALLKQAEAFEQQMRELEGG